MRIVIFLLQKEFLQIFRNKAMLHILQQGVSVDKNGEKVYLQDVYNQEEDLGEEE